MLLLTWHQKALAPQLEDLTQTRGDHPGGILASHRHQRIGSAPREVQPAGLCSFLARSLDITAVEGCASA